MATCLALACTPGPVVVSDVTDGGGADAAVQEDSYAAGTDVLVRMDAGMRDASEDTVRRDVTTSDTNPHVGTPCSTGDRDGVCLHVDDCGGMRESVPNHCPGPAPIQCCVEKSNSSEMCDPKASYAEMPRPNAGLTESAGDAGCPSGMVKITDFCIDRYEAALVELRSGMADRSWSPFFNPGNRRVRAVSIKGATPQAYISGKQAAAACKEAGKRLCTGTEWLRACQGAAGHTYPYGDTRQSGVCNDARQSHPVVDYFETSEDWIWSELQNACIGQQSDTVDPAGSNTGCVSDDGVFDMMGNLHEWTAASSGTFRGGFYADTKVNGSGCLYKTTAHGRGHWDYSTGFRCCADTR